MEKKKISEAEAIDEISKELADRYADKSAAEYANSPAGKGFPDKNPRKTLNRYVGLRTALNKQTKYGAKVPATEEVIQETLPASASASDYIHDFVHSKNKVFKGDSKKKRIKRALGAYYGKD